MVERERRGEGNLLVEEEEEEVEVVEVEVVVEVEGEGDMYLEDTCLPFGLLGTVVVVVVPLVDFEGNGSVEAAVSEMAATIIGNLG